MFKKLFSHEPEPTISAHEVFEGGDVFTVVDVREPDEWASGHIDHALHIPLGELDKRAEEIPQDKPVVTVCKVGGRSLAAVPILERAGLKGTRSMAGGMIDWKRRGYPTRRP